METGDSTSRGVRKVKLGTSHQSTPGRARPLVDSSLPATERPGGRASIRAAAEEGNAQHLLDQQEETFANAVEALREELANSRIDGDASTEPPAEATRAPSVKLFAPRTAMQVERDKIRFLKALEQLGSVALACKAIGRCRLTVVSWRRRDPVFAQAWTELWETKIDVLESGMMERATNGSEEAVYQQGGCVGTRTVHYPGLSMFMLSKNRPEQYGELALERKIADLEKSLESLKLQRSTTEGGAGA